MYSAPLGLSTTRRSVHTRAFVQRETVHLKKRRRKDPYAAREAARYARPIPSREFLLEFLADYEAPLTEGRLARALEIDDEEGLEGLRRRLSAMVRDGQLVRNRRDGFLRVNRRELISGRVLGHPDGYGFLRPDEGGDYLFLSPREMRVLLHGDRIVATVKGVGPPRAPRGLRCGGARAQHHAGSWTFSPRARSGLCAP